MKRLLAYELSEDDLAHLEATLHGVSPPCRYGTECRAYQRLCDRGDRLDDRCHLRLFAHPPRNRSEKLPDGFSPFAFDTELKRHHPDFEDMQKKSDEEQLAALIAEVECNGFGDDLVTRDGDSLLTVVDRKMAHPKNAYANDDWRVKLGRVKVGDREHVKNRAQMLALVLYTSCDCNYAMCAAERDGDYKTWKWFSWLLRKGLLALPDEGQGDVVYSGIPKTRLTERRDKIYLATHTSTSRDKSVAEGFMGKDGGMLVEIRRVIYGFGKDVSWVSKFPDEHETLFWGGTYSYEVKSVEIDGAVQKVVLQL